MVQTVNNLPFTPHKATFPYQRYIRHDHTASGFFLTEGGTRETQYFQTQRLNQRNPQPNCKWDISGFYLGVCPASRG